MKENQRKIEEQQKKMVRGTARDQFRSFLNTIFFKSGGGETQDDRGTNENRRGKT